MDPSVAGLIGAVIGAVAGVSGTLVAHYLRLRAERSKWLKSKREEAYVNAIRFLLKSLYTRTDIGADGTTIRKDAIKGLFDDLNEAQIWLIHLSIYCSRKYKETILKASESFSNSFSNFFGYNSIMDEYIDDKDLLINVSSGTSIVLEAYRIIVKCARKELERDIQS